MAWNVQKIVNISLNALFFIFGIILIGVGVYTWKVKAIAAISGSTLPIGIIVIGALISFTSLLGFLGAYMESQLLLWTYFGLLVALTVCLLGVGAAVYTEKSKASTYIISGWQSSNNDIKVSLQNSFACCGLNSYDDAFKGIPCPDEQTMQYQKDPCLPLLVTAFYSNFNTLGIIGISFASIQVVMVLAAFCMIRHIQHEIWLGHKAMIDERNQAARKARGDTLGKIKKAAASGKLKTSSKKTSRY